MSLRRLACLGVIALLGWPQNIETDAQLQIRKLLADGNAQEAEAAAQRFLGRLDQQDPAGNLETARLLDLLAAKLYLERAIAIFERTLGPDHLSTGNAVGDLASVVKLTGNYAEAKPLFERSLRIYELRLGPDHPRLAVPLNNLALCVKELDEL